MEAVSARTETKPPRGTQAIARALDILAAFSFDEPELGISDLMERLSLPRSTVYRLVSVLAARGFISYNRKTGMCRLGAALAQAGGIFLAQLDIRREAAMYLDELADKYQQTVLLGIHEGNRIIYVDKRESPRSLRVSSQILRSRPLSYGGLSRVVLAQYRPDRVRQLVSASELRPWASKSITDYELFMRTIDQARRDRYYIEIEEVVDGVYSVAAPVVAQVSDVVGAVGVVGPTIHMDSDLEKGLVEDVVAAGAAIAQRLG